MKRFLPALLFLALITAALVLSACTKSTKEWWLEMSLQNESSSLMVNLDMPMTIQEDNTLSGSGMLQIRQLNQDETGGNSECLPGEMGGTRLTGEITVIGTFKDDKILVESLEPTGGPGTFSVVFYCSKDDEVRDLAVFSMDSSTDINGQYSNAVIDSLFVISEEMLKYPLDPVDKFSGQDDSGFSFILHQGTLPTSRRIPTPSIQSE